MSQDTISRRQVLRAASVAGTFGLVSGGATQALLSDDEPFSGNTLAAGTMEIQLLTEDISAVSDPCDWGISHDIEDIVSATDPTLPPLTESSGRIGFAMAVCDNPGRVTLGLASSSPDEMQIQTNQTDTQGDDVNQTDESHGEQPTAKLVRSPSEQGGWKSGNFESAQEQERPSIRLVACDGEEQTVIADASPENLEEVFGEGITLGRSCRRLGKLEFEDGGIAPEDDSVTEPEDDTFVWGSGDDAVTVTITETEADDAGDARTIDVAVEGAGLCRVDVKGGGKQNTGNPGGGGGTSDTGSGVKRYTFDCEQEASGLTTPEHFETGKRTAISHLELYVCEDEGTCIDCTPHFYYLEWENLWAETEVDLTLTAAQCRHSASGGGAE